LVVGEQNRAALMLSRIFSNRHPFMRERV